MNTGLRYTLERRLRVEVTQLRQRLDLDSPLCSASHNTDPPVVAWRMPDGSIRSTAVSVGSVTAEKLRPATCGEVLDALEFDGIIVISRDEARVMQTCADIFVAETEREQVLLRAAVSWPWTRTVGASELGSESQQVSLNKQYSALLWSARDTALFQSGIHDPRLRALQLEPYPQTIDLADVIEWLAEGFDRCKSGSGAKYSEWCNGSLELTLSVDQQQQLTQLADFCGVRVSGSRLRSAEVLADRIRQPDGIVLKGGRPAAYNVTLDSPASVYSNELERVQAGLNHEDALVRGEQLACLYAALPSSVRTARSVRRLLAQIASADAQRHLFKVIAPRAISNAPLDEKEQTAAGDADAASPAGSLAEATRKYIASFHCARVEGALPTTAAEADQYASDLDEAFASHVARKGKSGKDLASDIRIASRNREPEQKWRLWERDEQGAERFLLELAIVLWNEDVKEALQRSERRRPAMVRAVVADRLLPLMTRQTVIPELDDGVVRDAKGHEIARIALTTDATLEAVRRGAHALGTATGNRLIRALIHRSHNAWNSGEQDPRRVGFEGGWGGVMSALRLTSHAHHAVIKEIAQAGACIVWETPYAKHGGLWLWSERRGTKAQPGEVAFVLGDALTPGYGNELSRTGNSLPARIARRLVPELRFEPPMGGARDRDHGPIWTLHRMMLVEMVDRAEELHAEGAVVITNSRWRELAQLAGVSVNIVDRTLAAWVAGEDEETAPALLVRVERDAWTLAQPHAPERDFIAAGGAKRANGRSPRTAAKRRRRAH